MFNNKKIKELEERIEELEGLGQMKLTTEEIRKIFPDEKIRNLFLKEDDIKILSPDEQEIEWQKYLASLNNFYTFLSETDAIIIHEEETKA